MRGLPLSGKLKSEDTGDVISKPIGLAWPCCADVLSILGCLGSALGCSPCALENEACRGSEEAQGCWNAMMTKI